MVRPPHPHTLFHLVPIDDFTANRVLGFSRNHHLVSDASNGKLGLEIGYHVSPTPRGAQILGGIGREGDIVIPDAAVSGEHVRFEVHPLSLAILLSVRAPKIDSVIVKPCEIRKDGDFRHLVLFPSVKNYKIHIVAEGSRFSFNVIWRAEESVIMSYMGTAFQEAGRRAWSTHLAKTVNEADTQIGSYYKLRTHNEQPVRYAFHGAKIGSGVTGTVLKAIDLDSGNFVAVKVLKMSNLQGWKQITAEIKHMTELSHPNIIKCMGHFGLDGVPGSDAAVQIFMPLKRGSLRTFLNEISSMTEGQHTAVLGDLLRQTCSALHFLDSQGIIHRDVKPDNILWDHDKHQYTFQLADLGLATHKQQVVARGGTPVYAPPEWFAGQPPTTKTDVWSLFVTITTLVAPNFFQVESFNNISEALNFVRGMANGVLFGIREMVEENPELRASAGQILDKHFNRQGLDLSQFQPQQHQDLSRQNLGFKFSDE